MKYGIWLASPLGLWALLNVLAILGVFGRMRRRRLVWVLANVQLALFSLPWVADQLMGRLEQDAVVLARLSALPARVDAIVVLGGGLTPAYRGFSEHPDLNDSADRMWMAARLYKSGVAPHVVVSGGGFFDDPNTSSEAEGMRQVLLDLGVPDGAIVMEARSRTTLENANEVLTVLQRLPAVQAAPNRVQQVVLVTSAFHMARATALFRNAGLTVFSAPTDFRVTPEKKPFWQCLPKPEALDRSTLSIKEYLGRLQLVVARWFV